MSVFIGHACIDERGKANSGTAGDQTSKEVYKRTWYSNNWTVLLRPKSSDVAEKMAKFCEAICNNNKVGYDQWQRNTLRQRAKEANWNPAKITTACETDCSAFMTVCAEAAGVDVSNCYTNGNAPVCSTMRKTFKATGAFKVLTDRKYLTGTTYLRRGDILVKEGYHTVMVLSNGSDADKPTTTAVDGFFPARGYFKEGDVSSNVGKIASFMRTVFPSYTKEEALGNTYGPNLIEAVTEFQSRSNLEPDGYFGPLTLAELKKHGFKA